MAAPAIRSLKPTPNHVLLNLIRTKSSDDYQRRIPAATKSNLSHMMEHLSDPLNRPLWNEFVSALLNRVGLVIGQSKMWSNPMAEFKIGMLPFGSTIEEYQVGLIKAQSYDGEREHLEKDIFGRHEIDVQSSFHTLNRQDVYPITINQQQLKQAFLEPNGLSRFVDDLMTAPATSDQWDEFLLMCNLFPEYEKNGGFFRIQVPDVADSNSTEADAKKALRTMRSIAQTMKFPSELYNAAGMPTWANPDELVVFTSPEFAAAIDVEALAAAFNIDYAAAAGRIITIPKERLGVGDAQAIITTKNFFMVADTHFEITSAFNPRDLHTNYFLHHWQIISASRFVPAIMLTTGPGTDVSRLETPVTSVANIVVTDRYGATVTTVKRGELYNVQSKAITAPADGVNDAVQYSVSNPTSSRTRVTNEGVLEVGPDEAVTSLTITARAVWTDPDDLRQAGPTKTLTLTVTGDQMKYWPVPEQTPAAQGAAMAMGRMVEGGQDQEPDMQSRMTEGQEPTRYDIMTNADLQAELAKRDLSTSGVKAEMISRLIESDQSQGISPAE